MRQIGKPSFAALLLVVAMSLFGCERSGPKPQTMRAPAPETNRTIELPGKRPGSVEIPTSWTSRLEHHDNGFDLYLSTNASAARSSPEPHVPNRDSFLALDAGDFLPSELSARDAYIDVSAFELGDFFVHAGAPIPSPPAGWKGFKGCIDNFKGAPVCSVEGGSKRLLGGATYWIGPAADPSVRASALRIVRSIQWPDQKQGPS